MDVGLVAMLRGTARAWWTDGRAARQCGMNVRRERSLGRHAARDMSGASASGRVLSSEVDGRCSGAKEGRIET